MIRPDTLVGERRLDAVSEGSRLIEIHECSTDRAEAELVVHSIERTIGGSAFFSMDSGRVESSEGESLSFGDFAILYRTKAQAEIIAEAFTRSGMPFRVHSHESLIDAAGVPTVLRAMDEVRRSMTVETTVPEILEAAVLAVRAQVPEIDHSLESLRALAARHRSSYARFRSELSLGVDVDLWDPRAEAVSLLTLHASKGLEFPVVFIVGCEDGILPFRLPDGKGNPTEERRLFFVGMTRAKRRLILTRAERRVWRGATRTLAPSPFLEAIAKELQDEHAHRAARKPKSKYRQLTLFDETPP
jgi:superfamily I DNA/RNA helicase